MRLLITLILIASVGWAAYWFVGSNGVQSGFAAWFEDRRSKGWAAEYTTLETKGFPNRFDTTFTDLVLADTNTGLAWEAPFFQLLALSYRPTHVIAIWPDSQLIATPIEKYKVHSTDMRASFAIEPDTYLSLDRAILTAEDIAIWASNSEQPTQIKALNLAVEHVPTTPSDYRLGISADGFSPALPWRVQVDPAGTLPETLDALSADITVTFDEPWDRRAVEIERPQPIKIAIKLAEARWGQLALQAAGSVTVDKNGRPTGEIVIKARNWREILRLAVASGMIPQSIAEPLENGLGVLAQLAGNPKTLDIPLNFSNGSVNLGPVPIGPAPILTLR